MASGIVESSQSGSSSEKDRDRVPASIPRQRLLQKLLAGGSDLPAFLEALIQAQGVVVAGTEAAAFLVEPDNENPPSEPGMPRNFRLRSMAHVRPDESSPEVKAKALQAFAEIVHPCVQQGKDGVIEVDASKKDTVDPQFCLVTLLRSDNQVVGVTAVIARAANIARAQQRLSTMELVAGYFEMWTLRHSIDQARQVASTHQNVLQLATTVATAEGFDAAAMGLCNELAARTGATRVAIGWVEGFPPKIKLKAMSHTEKFDKKQELAVLIIAAMEECLDQEDIVHYEPDGESGSRDKVTRAAAELSRTQGGIGVLTLPLRRGGEISGVILMEFNPQRKLPQNAETALAVAVELLGPQLFDRYQNDRWWITKTGVSIRETAKMVTGPKHMLAKVVIVLSVVAIAFLSLYRPMYKVVAPFQFAAMQKRIVSTPFEGFVGGVVKVKPGDLVRAGDVLLEMDTFQLQIQWAEADARAQDKRIEAQRYGAQPDKQAEYKQALQQMNAEQAAADLIKSQIDQAIVKAPIDGVILSGDWMDKRHTPIKKGEELFRIAKNDSFRVEMNVNERDIQDVSIGAKGWLATTSLPDSKKQFIVERIIPLPNPEQGSNVFKVYGTLDQVDKQWREGLQGEARIEVGKRSLLWQWTHRFVDWARIKLWI